jgi:hypothetical protein
MASTLALIGHDGKKNAWSARPGAQAAALKLPAPRRGTQALVGSLALQVRHFVLM